MGTTGDIVHPNETFQLRRIQFVPAQRPDVTPVPTGVDIIVLNGVLPVSVAVRQTQALSLYSPPHSSLQTCNMQEQDSHIMPGSSSMSKNTKELFREQDVSLNWKTVQKPVR